MTSASALYALARAFDKEDASQRGEPDPWVDGGDDAEWVSERLSCAEVAAAAYLSASPLAPVAVKEEPAKLECDSPEEWELEQRAFQGANCRSWPQPAQVLIADLWRAYCNAQASPPLGETKPLPAVEVAELVEQLRGGTMAFDWSDLPDDALIPAVPLLREAATALSSLSAERDEARDDITRGIEQEQAMQTRILRETDRAERAEASLTALREKLEKAEAAPALAAIRDERLRQIDGEGFTTANDDASGGKFAFAAACYTLSDYFSKPHSELFERLWPWSFSWWKPTDRRRDLVKAGALIVAEIERLDRSALATAEDAQQ